MSRLCAIAVLCFVTAAYAENPCVTVTVQNSNDDGFDLQAELKNCSEVTITVTLDEPENLKWLLPDTVDSAGRKRFLVGSFRVVEKGEPWRHRGWNQRWKYGRRLKKVPPPYTYAMPFEGSFPIIQGPRGTFSHGPGSGNEEAFDWRMPEGTPILAARAGTVTGLRADETEGGPDVIYRDDYNFVMVRHDDGTFAEYVHLMPGGVKVKLGEKVSTGQQLGSSGSTGFSSAPHLHFSVFHSSGRQHPHHAADSVRGQPRKRNGPRDFSRRPLMLGN